MMWWPNGGWGWAGWLMMTLTMLPFWGLVAWVVVSLVRSSGSPAPPRRGTGDAEAILAERFARGEIDAEEYRNRSELLRSGR